MMENRILLSTIVDKILADRPEYDAHAITDAVKSLFNGASIAQVDSNLSITLNTEDPSLTRNIAIANGSNDLSNALGSGNSIQGDISIDRVQSGNNSTTLVINLYPKPISFLDKIFSFLTSIYILVKWIIIKIYYYSKKHILILGAIVVISVIFFITLTIQKSKQASLLTNSHGHNFQPNVSSDGDKIVFISTRDGNNEVYIMNNDGSHQERLTYTPSIQEDLPSFSPGSELIIFSGHNGNDSDIFIYRIGDKQCINITNSEEHNERHARFIPGDFTSLNIIFTADFNKNNIEIYEGIYTNNSIDHINPIIIRPEFNDLLPSYINEEMILFRSTYIGENLSSLYIYNTINNKIDILSSGDDDFYPISTNNKNIILFVSRRNKTHHIYAMNINEKRSIQVTHNVGEHTMPSASPELKWIYYTWRSDNKDSYQIYRMPFPSF